MSAFAEFIRLPNTALEKLRADYDETLEEYGETVADYQWSGYIIATLIPYLNKKGIALTTPGHDGLLKELSNTLGIGLAIFTPAHKEAYLELLSPESFSKEELRDYFNKFNGADEPDEVGQAMVDGISAIQQSLASLDADSVILLTIG